MLVIGSQNCPSTQFSGSAEPIPAPKSDMTVMGVAASVAMVRRRKEFRMGRFCQGTVHDLLIATLANAHDVTLLHYDADFEIGAEVLPFRHRWALERGTIS